MPRGIPKTYSERMRDYRAHQRRVKRILRERPPRSPCLPGRIRHRFRSPWTRGPLNVHDHGDEQCWLCGKTFAQVKEEQKTPRKMPQEEVDILDNKVNGG